MRRDRTAASLSYTALEASWTTSYRPVPAPRRTGRDHSSPDRRGLPDRARERLLRRGRIRARDCTPLAPPGARGRGDAPGEDRDSHHGQPGAFHRHRPAWHHGVLDPPRCRRRADRRQLDRRAPVARRRLRRRVCVHHVPPRDPGRARAEGDRPRPQGGDSALGGAADRGRLHHLVPDRVVLPGVRECHDEARGHPAGAGRDHRALGRGDPHDRRSCGGDRGDRGRRAGDALQGVRLRRQGGVRRHGAAARGRGALDRPAARGMSRRRDGSSVHALPRLSRLARHRRGHPPHPRPHARGQRAGGVRQGERGGAAPPGALRAGDEGPRGAVA